MSYLAEYVYQSLSRLGLLRVVAWSNVCVLLLHPLISPSKGVWTRALSSGCKIDRANFTDCMPFLPPISWRKSALAQKPLAQIPKALQQQEIAEKTKMI